MTLRVAVVVDGNAAGAEKALGSTAAAIDNVAAGSRAAAPSADALAAAEARAATEARALALAQQTLTRATALAAMQQRNLAFQLNDVFVSLASGMNPLMVFIQQGSQIGQIYGPGEGGVGRALSETGKMAVQLVTKLWPLAAAAALFSAGVAGITHEINQNATRTVSWGDVALGVFQTIGDGLFSIVKPAVDAVSGWFEDNWNTIVQLTKDMINNNVRGFQSFFATIGYLVNLLAPIFRIGAEAAAKAFLGPIQWMVDQTIGGINQIIDALNSVGANLQHVDPFKMVADFGGDQAEKEIAALTAEFQKRLKDIGGTDYAGQFFDDVSKHAQKNAANQDKDKKKGSTSVSDYAREIASIRERTAALQIEQRTIGLSTFEAEKLRKAFELENAARKDGIGLTAARIAEIQQESAAYALAAAAVENTRQVYEALKDAWSGIFADMKSNLKEGQTLWQALGNAGVNAMDKLADKALGMAADGIFDMIWNAVMGGGNSTGGILNNILGGGPVRAGFNLPGFATGGSFRVGGAGATDSQIVAFRASPDETVSITRPGQTLGSGGGVILNFNPVTHIDASGSSMSEGQIRGMLDERDRQLSEQFADRVAYALDHPRRT